MTAEEMLAAYLNDTGETLTHFNEKHDYEFDDYLEHFNPNHDPRNGQFAKAVGGSISSTTSDHKVKNTAVREERVPEHTAKVRRVRILTAAGAVAGAGIALALLSGGLGATPIAALAASKAVTTGTGFMGAYVGGAAGLGAGIANSIAKKKLSDYLKDKPDDKKDWDRYIRSNTNYDKTM